MTNDTISRAAAVKTVKKHYRGFDNDLLEVIAYEMERLPSAQPGCEDAVYRKAVQMLLAYFVPEERYAEAVDGLRRLPSVTPKQPGWIPVTDRLPEKDGEYLVTIDWGDGDTEVDCYDYCANGTDWNDGDLFGAKVLAWMPLPTPYREGGQDEL